ncbi:MAG: ferric reductase-like transmembrane domain-containing protein [Candidatus Rokubacteria bacterium]|nr:ferric reductase-like transmembrane domain-containing protein [Candidatus Rokubacteria bacterium]
MTRRIRLALKSAAWAACLAPLGWLAYRFATGDLTANPISFVTTTLGDWTLRILLASLAMTPLRIVFGLSWPVGMLAFLSLIPLAATSTAGMVRRLGARTWTRLHRLAYAAGALGCLHFLWLAKVGRTDQYWHAAALAALLGVRLGDALVRRVRRRRRAAAPAAAGVRTP